MPKLSFGLNGLVIAFVVLLLAVLVFILQNPPWQSVALPDIGQRLEGLSGDQLTDAKARAEIVQLELANRTAASPWGLVLGFVPLGSAIVAALAIFATIWKTNSDRRDEAEKARLERETESQRQLREAERDRELRDTESQRQLRESFDAAITNLSAASASLRASAAIALGTFLRPQSSAYHEDVLLVAIAKSKIGMEDDNNVRALISGTVERAMRLVGPNLSEEDRRYALALQYCLLDRIDLSEVDLHGADIAFGSFRHADFRNANLFRVQGIKVNLEKAQLSGMETNLREARLQQSVAVNANFHNAICTSIRLEDADLRGAQFQRAKLQEAHFRGADLAGARFEGADLNNAFFAGAKLDDTVIRNIAKGAINWRKANFDAEQLNRLNDVAAPKEEGEEPGAGPAAPQPDETPGA